MRQGTRQRRRKWLAFLLPALLLLLGGAAVWVARANGPQKPPTIPRGDYTYARDLATHKIDQVMKQRHIPGAAVVLVDDQEIVWQASFGLADREQETPVDSDTVFKLWSLAKPFTAIEIMRLVEEGRVDLDAPLTRYVPGLAIPSRFPNHEPITVRHLLAHRAGLPRNACHYGFGWELGADALDRLASALNDCFLAYPPGSHYKYSNVGYDTLGYIIQDLRGRVYPVQMREQLLLPIGMSHSAFYSTDLPSGSELAMGYEYYEGAYYPYEQRDIGAIPSGNLYATVGDLAAFVKFIFRDGEANDAPLIGPETLAAMFEDQYGRPADPQPMGLGWKLGRLGDAELLVWHDGGPTEGIGSLIAMLPDRKLAVVLLGNATSFEGSVALPIAMELLAAMLETRDGWVASEQAPEAAVTVDASVLERYRGGYAAFGDIMDVTLTGGRLKGGIQGFRFDLVPVAENRFRVSHWLLKLGLADLLQLPMDLSELRVEFQTGVVPASDRLIIDFGGVNYEICSRYPPLPDDGLGEALAGRYELFALRPSGTPGSERLGERTITFDGDRLFMSGVVGPILPIDDKTLIILGGSFHGETMTYDPETGYLTHQGLLFKPAAPATERDG